MKLHDLLEELEQWLEMRVEDHKPLDNMTSSSYLNAYKSVQFKIEQLKDKHE